MNNTENRCYAALCTTVTAAAITAASVIGGIGHAGAGTPVREVPIGQIDGYEAFQLGPYADFSACDQVARPMRALAGGQPSPRYANCFQGAGGWYLLSRWEA